MLENEYYYELKYVYKDKVVSMKFNGEQTLNQIVENIQDFLKSTGWREDTIKEHIKTDDDMWQESEKEKDNCKCDDIKKEDETYYQEYNCPDNNYYDNNAYHGYVFNDNNNDNDNND